MLLNNYASRPDYGLGVLLLSFSPHNSRDTILPSIVLVRAPPSHRRVSPSRFVIIRNSIVLCCGWARARARGDQVALESQAAKSLSRSE